MNASVMDGTGLLLLQHSKMMASRLQEERRQALIKELLERGPAVIEKAIAGGQTEIRLKELPPSDENRADMIEVAHRLCREEGFRGVCFDIEADRPEGEGGTIRDGASWLTAEWSYAALSRPNRVATYMERRKRKLLWLVLGWSVFAVVCVLIGMLVGH